MVTTGSRIFICFISSRKQSAHRCLTRWPAPRNRFDQGNRTVLQIQRFHIMKKIQHGRVDAAVVGGSRRRRWLQRNTSAMRKDNEGRNIIDRIFYGCPHLQGRRPVC